MKDARKTLGSRAIGMACMLMAGVCAGTAQAQDMIPGGQETFKLNLGGILNVNNTNLRLDGAQGRGTDIDLESVTGLDEDLTSFLVSGEWRFAANHRFGIDYFNINRDRTKVIDRTIMIGDTTIPINANLSTEAKTEFFIMNYQYSFMKSQDMELSAIVGLYGAKFEYKFTANNPVINVNASTRAPLPLFGVGADFYLNPRWSARVFGEGLKVKVGDVDGSMYYLGASTDYMFTRNWGVGIGYRLADLKVDVDKSGFRGHAGWKMDSYTAYLQARF